MAYALERTGPLTTGQRARFLKDIRASLREQDRKKLAKLREDINAVKKRRREAMRVVRSKCRRLRCSVRANVKAFRAQERERVNAQVASMREQARGFCESRKAAVKAAAWNAEQKARWLASEEKRLQRDLRTADQLERKMLKARAAVRSESDDEVRQNIDAELLPVWEKVKRSIRGTDRISRTEAFAQWVEENPSDAVRIQQDAADVELRALLREQKVAERDVKRRRARSYKLTRAELAKYLEGVPF